MHHRSRYAALALILTLGLAACSQGDASPQSSDSQITVTLIGKGTDDHWSLVRDGAMAAGEDLGVQVNYNAPDTENEGDRQINMLEAALQDNPAGIGLAPQDGAQDAAPAILQRAADSGVAVVAFDTVVEGTDVPLTTIASDNRGIGEQLAEHVAELIDYEGDVAMVTQGVVGTAAERRDGFVDWLEQNAEQVRVVDIQNGEADPAKSRDKAQGILQAHPDLKALVGTSNFSTIAIADEVAATGRTVVVAGVDAAPDVLTLIREGKIAGIVAQNPYEIGYQTVRVLTDAINGQLPEEELVVTDSLWVTAENIDDEDIARSLGLQ